MKLLSSAISWLWLSQADTSVDYCCCCCCLATACDQPRFRSRAGIQCPPWMDLTDKRWRIARCTPHHPTPPPWLPAARRRAARPTWDRAIADPFRRRVRAGAVTTNASPASDTTPHGRSGRHAAPCPLRSRAAASGRARKPGSAGNRIDRLHASRLMPFLVNNADRTATFPDYDDSSAGKYLWSTKELAPLVVNSMHGTMTNASRLNFVLAPARLFT